MMPLPVHFLVIANAEQVRFGARSGAAPIFLGIVKLALGLVFGSSLLKLLQSFPGPLLGSMLTFSGKGTLLCSKTALPTCILISRFAVHQVQAA